MTNWTANDMPDQTGRIAIVTGANSGLGLGTTIALARKGATVIMACRNAAKAQAALAEVKSKVPGAKADLMALDLGRLQSVRDFATAFKAKYDRLDLPINNAGLMAVPRSETPDGFETQFGVNHLGHFALTALLIDLLLRTPNSRVVTVSSGMNAVGRMHFDDLMGKRHYSRYGNYSQSKLANIVFANELQRRLAASGASTISNSAHPGYVITNLQSRAANEAGSAVEGLLNRFVGKWVAQPTEGGIAPQLFAATAPEAKGGAYYGPSGLFARGHPAEARPNKQALDPAIGKRLWEVSEQLTGIPFTIPVQHKS
jgi:NAD(P)-dependent dehydrogenase (short-subunit alcohol dehydrogenase family)